MAIFVNTNNLVKPKFLSALFAATPLPACVGLALLVLCSGCRQETALEPFFPLGIYGVTDTNDFPVLRQAGFTLVTGPAKRDFLNAAQASGLRVLANMPADAQLDAHPALWAWSLMDEPDLHQVPPPEVAHAQALLRQSGVRQPIALTLWNGSATLDYGQTPDIVMVDRYPVPWLPVASFGQQVRQARLGIGPHKPLIAVVQAFPWSLYSELLADEPEAKTFRPPNRAELRCMVYDAFTRGANGFFFYAFAARNWKLAAQPELWADVQSVVAEIRARQPLFQAAVQWWPRRHRFPEPRGRFNAALESSVSSVWVKVATGNSAVPAGDYVLAVNTTDHALPYAFVPPIAVANAPAVFGENRSLALKDQWLEDRFAPFAVHLYGPLSAIR